MRYHVSLLIINFKDERNNEIDEREGKRLVLRGVSLETRFDVKAACLSNQYVVVVARP